MKYWTEPIRCNLCQLLVPYSEVARKLRGVGFDRGTIYAYYHPHDLAGNLRVEFPHASIISTKFPKLEPTFSSSTGDCLIIWTAPPQGVMNGLGMITQFAKHFSEDASQQETLRQLKATPEKFLRFSFDRTRGRIGRLGYIFLRDGFGKCS